MEFPHEDYDVIIIGAGIMGSCSAYEIAKRGKKVLLLEQFDFLHQRGSSHGESRTTRATYPEPYYSPLVLESNALWEQAQDEIGYRVCAKARNLDLARSDSKVLRAIIANCQSHSIPYRILDRHQVAGEYSATFDLPDGWIGLSTDMGGVIKATKAVAMFQSLAIRRGAHLMDRMKVTDIKMDGKKGGILASTACGRTFQGRKCVVTVGAWMRELVKMVTGLDLPIQPLHTALSYWKIKDGSEGNFTLESGFPTFASYEEPIIYGTPVFEYPGLIKISVDGGCQCDPEKRNWTMHKAQTNVLSPWIEGRLSGRVESDQPVFTQSCMYSVTPDGDYVIDFLGGQFGQDVVIAGGFSGHGFKMGPVVGRIVADLALDGVAHGVDLCHFRIGRFVGNPKGNVKDFQDQERSHELPQVDLIKGKCAL